ncbi:MaoC family dehydratase [Streptomyces phaeolivaceus]|uniref:MaoC family dehydratase n=2 Tax=Streptomyces phaeolivaceus TaxID=2653200 RepID=A0A5P8KIN9_9ACTN|nr:MaoC family dehydratase [Streptomyces phaeolivaceus]QFR03146.1 MaoC family dehydratase [Streptomyces phaeolivaceus]
MKGESLGTSDWFRIDQDRIGRFADATDDHQWIHVDPERAKDGPFGAAVAHGFLTLSLLIPLWSQVFDVADATTSVNYGLNKVRFPAPVPAGSEIRLTGTVTEVEEVAGGAVQITADVLVEIRGGAKPACVAQPVFRFYR